MTRDEKKSIMTSGCQKCQSNLAGTWFSHCSLLFLEDFTMDEDQKPTMLRDLEIDFLKEHQNIRTRYYFDPMNGRVHTILSTSVPKSKLIELIDDIR